MCARSGFSLYPSRTDLLLVECDRRADAIDLARASNMAAGSRECNANRVSQTAERERERAYEIEEANKRKLSSEPEAGERAGRSLASRKRASSLQPNGNKEEHARIKFVVLWFELDLRRTTTKRHTCCAREVVARLLHCRLQDECVK